MPELRCGCLADSCGDCEVDCCGAECCEACCECVAVVNADESPVYSQAELERAYAIGAENKRIRHEQDEMSADLRLEEREL